MKRKHYFYVLVACGALTLASCSDNNDDVSNLSGELTVEEVAKLPYSSLTPEQQKEKLGQETNTFIAQMSDLSKEKAIQVFKGFNSCVNISSPSYIVKGAEDIVRINSFYGKFTWNPGKQGWDESELTSALVFEFPVGNSATNNGKIEVTGVASSSTIEGNELPKQLTAKIYHGGSQVASIDVQGEITVNNDEITTAPASASVSFQMGSYTFAENFNKADKKATATLQKGDITLMSIAANVSGDIDKAIDDEDAITGANFSMKLLDNLAIVGSVDIANYNKDIAALDAQCYPDGCWRDPNFDSEKAEENYTKGNVDLQNKYYNLYLVSMKENTKIAKLTYKAISQTGSYTSYQWKCDENYNCGYDYDNPQTNTWVEWNTVSALKFNDNTEVDADVYFTEGFNTVIDNFEKFIKSFE